MNDVCIFVLACEKYKWIYPHFFHFANKNLFQNPEYTIPFYFFAEEPYLEHTQVIPGEKWGDRFWATLSILSKYKNVIYLQEDFLIKSVNIDIVKECLDLHNRHNNHITKLGNNYEFKTYKFPDRVGCFDIYKQYKEDIYLMSHQPVAIFNREFLLSTISEDTMDASSHEINGSKIMRETKQTKVMCVGESFNPNKSIIFEIEHAIRKGELLPDAKRLIERENLQ